jgi:hypothetical protein
MREQYDVSSRNTIKMRVLKRRNEEKAKTKMRLEKELVGRRAVVTTYMWTSAAERGYLVVTAHNISND